MENQSAQYRRLPSGQWGVHAPLILLAPPGKDADIGSIHSISVHKRNGTAHPEIVRINKISKDKFLGTVAVCEILDKNHAFPDPVPAEKKEPEISATPHCSHCGEEITSDLQVCWETAEKCTVIQQ